MSYTSITIGGRERPIAMTSAAMAALQARFRFSSAAAWLLADVMGCDLGSGTNTSYNLNARFAAIGAALECGAKKTYPSARIAAWYDAAIADGSVHDALWAIVACAYESGAATGRIVDDFDLKSGALRAVFFAATPAELQAAVDTYWERADGSDGAADAIPESTTTSSVAAANG